MGLFQPVWKGKNVAKAQQAVEQVKDRDYKTRIKIAMETQHREVFMAVIERMHDGEKGDVVMGSDYVRKDMDLKCSVKRSWYEAHVREVETELIAQIDYKKALVTIAEEHAAPPVREMAMSKLVGDPNYTEFIIKKGSADLGVQALSYISDDNDLLKVATKYDNSRIRISALSRIKDKALLVEFVSKNYCSKEDYAAVLDLIGDDKSLHKVALKGFTEDCRRIAFNRIKDDALLADVIIHGKFNGAECREALKRISDENSLRNVASSAREGVTRTMALERVKDDIWLASYADWWLHGEHT